MKIGRLSLTLATMTSVAVASIVVPADRLRGPDEMAKLGVHVDARYAASRRASVHFSISVDASDYGQIPTCYLRVYSKPIETEMKSGGRRWFSKRFLGEGVRIVRRELLIQRGVGADLLPEEVDCSVLEVWQKRSGDRMNFDHEELLLLRDVEIKANQSPEPTAMSVTPPAAQEPRQP